MLAVPLRPLRTGRMAMLGLCGAGLIAGAASLGLAQGISEQQVRCLQLQQELASLQGGGGANREEIARVEQQIAQADRVFQGTRAAMEDAGCFESFFIFGRGLVRSPKCLNMNDRVEDARRQLTQLQQQRQALRGGGGNKRRQAELQAAMARSGCAGVAPQPARRGGGLFDFFGGGREEMEQLPQTPIYRSIDPNGRYRSVCVRLCDGFYYPVSYSTYGSRLGQDAERCQSTCAAPAELYVYRNPGQDIEQAVSLSGSAYLDLPVALRYRKEYVKGCSCKQAEYNPTEIEAANKRAEAGPGAQPEATSAVPAAAPAPPPPEEPPAQMAIPADTPQLDLDVTGSNEPAPPPEDAAEAPPAAIPEAQQPPPPPPAAAAPPPLPAPPPTAQAAPPPAAPPPTQSTVTKRKPAAPPASPFAPQF
ncbi:MAG TPA: DUF2865 domain-containing protein [Methyloceanibacter sp.]|nr:DUF2865 domain-containing protein [Methyloceanibacter sp.]